MKWQLFETINEKLEVHVRFFRLFIIKFLLINIFQASALAADIKALKKLFESTWTTNYVEGRCGLNIENLVSKAMDENIDLSGAQIIGLKDIGGWMFGMVNAVQAREATRFGPGETNWYFHVFLLAEGMVFDYDFTNSPRIININEYMHEMYLPKEKWKDLKYKESKMKLFELELYPAEDYLYRLRARQSRSEVATKIRFKDYMPSFFTGR